VRLRRLLLAALLCLCASGAVAASAQAAATWNLEMHHNETNFPPGGKAQYWFDINNVGSSASSGPITLTAALPAGLALVQAITESKKFEFLPGPTLKWSCTGSSTVVCKTEEGSVPRHTLTHIILEVEVSASSGETLSASAALEGGSAANSASDSEPTPIDSSPAGFGIVASAFKPDFVAADGLTPERESGGHPDLLTFPVDFNSVAAPTATKPNLKREAESIRDLSTDLPPGFIGAPTAIGECTQAQYTVGECPPSSQVGRFDGSAYPPGAGIVYNFATGVFNMVHPRGAVTDLGFNVNGNPVHVKVSLNPTHRYAVVSKVSNINESVPPFSGKVTVWGVPADKSHDSERCQAFSQVGSPGHTDEECSTDHARVPFLTMPSGCEEENTFRFYDYDSWQHTGIPNSNPTIEYTAPGTMTECGKAQTLFVPQVSLEPTGHQANTPTGLDVHITVPQNDNANGLATPPVRSTVVTLPKGMAVNPGFADGLVGCSMDDFGIRADGIPDGEPVSCPDNSRIGEVSVSTPLLPKPVEGSMYLAKQEANPFGSLLAIYLALHDTEERGVLVKVPLKVSLDPVTGQITTTAGDLPQFPFEELTLKFRSGPRAPLVNPPSCGAHEIAATMTSYAQPGEAILKSSSYQVSEAPGGGPCQPGRPFNPQLIAGTANPLAGAFSPLSMRVFRSDADQEISSVEGVGPPGLTASLRGVGRCSEAQIAAAAARNKPGQGALEITSPSCPASSQVGTVQAGAGAGPSPIYVPGKVYMAGPYKGAPLSGVAIVPAVAGPTDLGVVVVRAPAYVNPRTAQVRIASDPLPQIVNGVLIRTRDVRIHLDRPGFALNPTGCQPKAIDATLRSTEGAAKLESEHFQVGDCGRLGFKPRLSLKLTGGTRRGAFPKLRAVFRPRSGDANLERMALRFPRSEFIEQGHFRTICTRVQYAASQCPPGSVYGHIRAFTPLLDEPLEGPVFLRSSNHNLPDAVFVLHGIIDAEVVVRIDSAHGGLRATIEESPDVPVSEAIVTMQGGAKGLFVNSTNICLEKHHATAQMGAQNGKRFESKPLVKAAGCGKSRKGRRSDRR